MTTPDLPVTLYDTTLRDGTQGENITLSLADKLRVARMLDEYGFPFIEGGWPGSNPKDIEFFAAAVARALADGWRTGDLADPADPTDGLVVVGTTGFTTAVLEALETGAGVAA